MMNPMISVADAAPSATPRRMASCFTDSLLAGAEWVWIASGVLRRSIGPPGLEYVVRVMPGQPPVATAEANRSKFSIAGGRRGSGPWNQGRG